MPPKRLLSFLLLSIALVSTVVSEVHAGPTTLPSDVLIGGTYRLAFVTSTK